MDAQSYQRLIGNTDDEKSQSDDSHIEEPISRNKSSTLRPVLLGVVLGFLLCLSGVIMVEILQPKNKCTQKFSAWSPALEIFDDNDISLHRFNGTLRIPHAFSGPPSDEIDERWKEITYPEGGLMRITKEQRVKIGAPDYASEFTEEMGGGYMAGFEVFHGLHCVNMLRQATYLDHYLPKNREWREDPETLRYHLDHCIDMLRQKLMCDPDLGLVTYAWTKGFPQAFPDFNTVHKCRPYDKVLDWAHANSIHDLNVSQFVRPAGALEIDHRP